MGAGWRRAARLAGKKLFVNWELYLFLVPAVAYLAIFCYGPMYGAVIAFKDFKPYLGILGSPFAGVKHFARFFSMPMFPTLMRNTLTLSLYSLLAGFPLPIVLALLINASDLKRFKKTVQTVTYAPHFISTVIVVGMINVLFSPSTGIVSNMLNRLGLISGPLDLLTDERAFAHLYVWSGVWQNMGWGSIIYLGALSGVDYAQHEAAIVDGANRLQRIIHIDLPAILPTIVILLILDCGKIMNVGFEKVFLMQNSLNLTRSEIINTYVYKIGITEGQFSLSTAIGLFNSAVNFLMILLVNTLVRKIGQESLW